jgi:penicillin-binding protein 2
MAIANGGTLYRPRVVDKIVGVDGQEKIQPTEIINTALGSAKNIKIVQEGMRSAVTTGSARSLNALKVPVAAKTGTAQAGTLATHAWFTCFLPYGNPDLVLSILVERGGEGSVAAAPIAREVLEWYIENRELTNDKP